MVSADFSHENPMLRSGTYILTYGHIYDINIALGMGNCSNSVEFTGRSRPRRTPETYFYKNLHFQLQVQVTRHVRTVTLSAKINCLRLRISETAIVDLGLDHFNKAAGLDPRFAVTPFWYLFL